MLSVARTKRSSEQIRTEIEQTFGFLPPFFEPALASPQVLENFWQQTLSAYVENPLSALFKEKLNALLSRFCTAPYCIIVHSSALRPLGMTAQQVLALLDAPLPNLTTELPLGGLPIPTPEEAAAPAPDSRLETVLLYCATSAFLERADAPACQAEMRRLLGPDLYPHLVAYLAYIKACHTWIEAYPEVSYEADRRAQDNLGPLLAAEPALGDFFRHYQERVRGQGLGRERRRAAEESLRAAQARTAAILESITDGFHAVDRDWRFTYLNAEAERLIFRQGHELLGKNIWEEFPAAIGSTFEREYRRAMVEQTPVSFEEFYPPLGVWLEVRAFPSPDGLSVFFRDVTEQAERRRQEKFLADLAERTRGLTNPDEVIADAVRSLGEFLGASRVVFADIDITTDECTIPLDYCADEAVASMAGTFPISTFGPFLVGEYGAGRTVTADDVRGDPERFPPDFVVAYDAVACRAFVAAPVLHSARLVSVLAVHSPVPRHWRPEEVELIQEVVESTWLTVKVTRQNRALENGAEALRQSEARYRLLVEGAKDYAMILMDPDGCITSWNAGAERIMGWAEAEVLGQAADLIFTPEDCAAGVPAREIDKAGAEGQALNLRWHLRKDGSLFYADGIMEGLRGEDGHLHGFAVVLRDATNRKALEDERSRFLSLAENSADFIGMSDMDDVPFYVNPAGLRMVGLSDMTQATRTRGIEFFHEDDRGFIMGDLLPRVLRDGHGGAEVRLRHFGTGTPIWVNYTLFTLTDGEGRLVGLATVSRDIRERKALDEERATLFEREHAIASQLQAALQPELPGAVPGLAVTKYYEAALAQSEGVGGDFFDVFAVEKGCTALVVGDLSGKGLAAAAQVSMVRNMLRAFLYTQPTVVGAVTSLNRVLAENNLLTGFTTLFVGAHDSATGILNYVNCGQEPALVRRAAGAVEQLLPTGPVLGSFEGAAFEERTVTLGPGDAVAIYTDGLTEVGPSRKEMLGIEGVVNLLAGSVIPIEADSTEAAEYLALRLIAGVDAAAAGGVMRDDVCLLVAVVDGI